MLYKDDWEQSKKRYEAWWHCEVIDRALVQAYAPRDNVTDKPPAKPGSMEEEWTDIDYVIRRTRYEFATSYFGGDAFPCFWPNLGPDLMAGALGAEMVFAEGTSWSKPFVQDWKTFNIVLREDNRWWKLIQDLTHAVAADSHGDYVTGITDLHPSLDCLSALRGPEKLCIDMIEQPELIQNKLMDVTEVFKVMYDRLYDLIHPYQSDGSTTTMPIWYPGGKYFINCCDFIYMISPGMFREFALPVVQEELRYLDATAFHVDGIGSLRHLDDMLELPTLKAIQWAYGDGQPSAKHWIPMLKKVRAAGKAIYTYGPAEDYEALIRELGPEGLLYTAWCKSESEARDFVRSVEKWSYQKKVY